mgnify:CR=1 FL=1
MNNFLKSFVIKFILIFGFFVILFSSIVNIYEKRNKITGLLKAKVKPGKIYAQEQHKLAKDIINGGYILLFRHAEREKWIDVKKYDSIEILDNLNAEDEYFSKAVCLSDRGLIQARAMGEIIEKIKLPFHTVITSPSCRARQTAELAFGGYDDIKNIFMHYGPYFEDADEFIKNVKKEILKIEVKKDSNAIISAHNGVIRSTKIFDQIDKEIDFSQIAKKFMEEGGFIVMKKNDGKLIFVDLFFTFHDFQLNFHKRPSN